MRRKPTTRIYYTARYHDTGLQAYVIETDYHDGDGWCLNTAHFFSKQDPDYVHFTVVKELISHIQAGHEIYMTNNPKEDEFHDEEE